MMKRLLSAIMTVCTVSLLASCDSSLNVPKLNSAASETALEKALRTGDVSGISEPQVLIDSLANSMSKAKQQQLDISATLFNLNADGSAKSTGSLTNITWNPTHDAALLGGVPGSNSPILLSNAVTILTYPIQSRNLGLAGYYKGDGSKNTPYMVLGSNPMRTYRRNNASMNEQMHQLLQNSVGWLAGRDNFDQTSLNVVIAQMDNSFYFPDRSGVREWLDLKYPSNVNYNAQQACDGANLAGCINSDTDILIISQIANDNDVDAITQTVKKALDDGIAVFYMHHNGDFKPLAKKLFPLMRVKYESDNVYHRLTISHFNRSQTVNDAPALYADTKTLIDRINTNGFTANLTDCADNSCPDASKLKEDFLDTAYAIYYLFDDLEKDKTRIFDTSEYQFEKSLILLIDIYRQQVTFPMDKDSTPISEFFKAQLTDLAAYVYRDINPAQKDMGNYSRSDFSHVTPSTVNVTMKSKRNFRSAGVYALPGQTFTIKRTDNSATTTKIAVSTLRGNSTHLYDKNAYNRPQYTATTPIEVTSGETIRITTPYGGPVQVHFGTNDLDVAFTFENVGQHPYWNDDSDNDAFEAALAKGDYDWAELVTPGFEVHSTLSKMRQSLSDPRWGNAAAIANNTETYIHNLPHVLAGFTGPRIDVIPEIHNFANTNGWTIENIDLIKHMNADQALCGSGCSGNPYDAYWNFDPLSHGDLHELGHGLEKHRFRFTDWQGHAITNFYSYYSKSLYFDRTGNEPNCQKLPFKEMFDNLVASEAAATDASTGSFDPAVAAQYMKDNANMYVWNRGVSMYIQMMMYAEAEGILTEGWHLLARLHMLEREFNRADNNEAAWNAARANLGFGTYTYAEKVIPNDDWLLIALSYILKRDMRAFLSMYGLSYSAKASTQVAAAAYASAAPKVFYAAQDSNYCKGLNKPAVMINKDSVWPTP